MSRLLNNSKRQLLMYVVLVIWVLFGIFAILYGADLNALSVYFSSLALPFIGYILGESWRPSNKKNIE